MRLLDDGSPPLWAPSQRPLAAPQRRWEPEGVEGSERERAREGERGHATMRMLSEAEAHGARGYPLAPAPRPMRREHTIAIPGPSIKGSLELFSGVPRSCACHALVQLPLLWCDDPTTHVPFLPL